MSFLFRTLVSTRTLLACGLALLECSGSKRRDTASMCVQACACRGP